MDESEVQRILLTLVDPYRNDPTHPSITSDNVKGWDSYSSDADDKSPPVCEWTGVECDPNDGSIMGLNLSKGFWIESLLGCIIVPSKNFTEKGAPHRHRLLGDGENIQKRRLHSSSGDISQDVPPTVLSPTLPSSIGKLLTLRMINLSSNQIHGTIPKPILDLPMLEYLDLGSNQITGPFPHFRSEVLRLLDISKNKLHGTLPKDIFAHPSVGPDTAPFLSTIMKFDISHNSFHGTIPLDGRSGTYDPEHKIDTSFQNLLYFDVGNNMLTGTICNNFGNMASLKALFLEHNMLVGTIPKSLYRGSGIGAHPLPLTQLYLQQNYLSGTIPSGLSTLPDLKELFIDGNKLTGSVPEGLCKAELNNDFLNDDEASKRCDGVSCPPNAASQEGVAPCSECPDDEGFNRYLGRHGKKCKPIMNETEILDLLFEQTHGERWYDGRYFWTRGHPACQRKGVQCNKSGNVVNITLVSLGLRGSLPTELGSLSALTVFNVSNNDLTGFLPSDFRFAPITQLDVKGNRMIGQVPTLLCIKDGLNKNGVGPPGKDFELLYSCDNVVCRRGSYSRIGRASLEDNITCLPCLDDASKYYIGRDHCTDLIVFHQHFRMADVQHFLKYGSLVVAIFASLIFVSKWRRGKENVGSRRSAVDNDQVEETGYCSEDDDDWTAADSTTSKWNRGPVYLGLQHDVPRTNRALHQFSSNVPREQADVLGYCSDDDWSAADSEADGSRYNRGQSELATLRAVLRPDLT